MEEEEDVGVGVGMKDANVSSSPMKVNENVVNNNENIFILNSLCFRETSPFISSTSSSKIQNEQNDFGWKELYLFDKRVPFQKEPECGSGFAFRGYLEEEADISLQQATRNRFIIWRIFGETLELLDVSLDLNLIDNALRIHFGSPILPEIGFFEVSTGPNPCLCVIIGTEGKTLHRLVFPHPISKLTKGFIQQSIFSDYTSESLREAFHLQNVCRNTTPKHLVCISDCEVALGCNSGSIFVIKFSNRNNEQEWTHTEMELVDATVLKRIWDGIVSKKDPNEKAINGMAIHKILNHSIIVTVCADQKIRVWSLSKQTCIYTKDISNQSWKDSRNIKVIRQNLRLYSDVKFPNTFRVVVSIQSELESQFQIFSGNISPTEVINMILERINYCDREDAILKDFQVLPSTLWTLWNINRKFSVQFSDFNLTGPRDAFEINSWTPAFMEDPTKDLSDVSSSRSIPDYYIKQIFSGKFSKQILQKSLQTFIIRHNIPNRSNLSFASVDSLKKEVISVVQDLINIELSDNALAIFTVSQSRWQTFLDICLEYWRMENTCVGLFTDPVTHLVIVIKLACISFIRPCEDLEGMQVVLSHTWKTHLESAQEILLASNSFDKTIGKNNQLINRDMVHLIGCLEALADQLGVEALQMMEEDLFHKLDPLEFMFPHISWLIGGVNTSGLETLTPEQLQRAPTFILIFCEELQKIQEPFQTIQMLLEYLETSNLNLIEFNSKSQFANLWCGTLFKSVFMESLIEFSLRQTIESRFILARNLNILLFLLLSRRNYLPSTITKQGNFVSLIQSEFLPRSNYLLRTYYALKWLSNQFISNSQKYESSLSETGIEQLSSLDISEGVSEQFNLQLKIEQGCNAFQLYYDYYLTNIQRIIFSKTYPVVFEVDSLKKNYHSWHIILPLISSFIDKLLHPGTIAQFGEFLAMKGQFILLQEYVRLLDQQNNVCFLHLLALCYLNFGQYHKAKETFFQAAGISQCIKDRTELIEQFKNLWYEDVDAPSDNLTVEYYKCVIQLFETFRQHDFAIEFAFAAIGCDPEPHILSFLYSSIFQNAISIPAYDKAYVAILSNPDEQRKEASLKRLILLLAEKDVPKLCSLPWIGFLDLVHATLDEKALLSDITKLPNYYFILYSFHVSKKNYRQASNSMFQYAQRLNTEMSTLGIESLYQQANSYAMVINTLSLVEERYQWFVIKEQKYLNAPKSPKRKFGSEVPEFINSMEEVPQVEIRTITLRDIKRHYMMTMANIRIFQLNPKYQFSELTTVGEIIGLLAEAEIFDLCESLAREFDADLGTLFKSLARKCMQTFPSGTSYDLQKEIVDHYWKLIKKMLKKFDSTNMKYHSIVVERIFSTNPKMELPIWLVNQFKQRDGGALLRLYLKFQRFDDAISFAIKLIEQNEAVDIAIGHRLAIPLNTILQILQIKQPKLNGSLENLQNKLQNYIESTKTLELTEQENYFSRKSQKPNPFFDN